MFVRISEKSGNCAKWSILYYLSDACWSSSFGQQFLFFFLTCQANSRSMNIVQRSVKCQRKFREPFRFWWVITLEGIINATGTTIFLTYYNSRWLKTVSAFTLWWVIITTLQHLMLQSWYQKTTQLCYNFCDAIGYHSNSMTC